jgi:membrane protein
MHGKSGMDGGEARHGDGALRRLESWVAKREGRPGWLSASLRTALLAGRAFVADRCLFRASALTYTTVLSLVPLLALAFAVAKGFGFYGALLQDSIGPFLDRTFGPLQETTPLIVREVGAHEMRVAIEQVLRFVERTDVSGLGLFGLLLLLYSVVKLLSEVEVGFNDIWRVSRARTWVRKIADYLALVVVAPIFVFTAAGTTTALSNSSLVEFLRVDLGLGSFLEASIKFAPVFALWIGFTFVYMTMPNTRVRFLHALCGAIVAGTLWQVVLLAHIQFQIGIAKHNAIYSSFAALPIFLLWVHISWTTVLMGAEVARARAIEPAWGGPASEGAGAAQRQMAGLRAMARLAADHLRGGPLRTSSDLGAQLSVDPGLLDEVLRRCARAGLVREAVEGAQRGWVLARDAEAVRLADVLDAIDERGLTRPPRAEALDHELSRRLEALLHERADSAHNRSLRSLVEAAEAHGDDKEALAAGGARREAALG